MSRPSTGRTTPTTRPAWSASSAGLAALDRPVLLLAHPRLVAAAAKRRLSLDRGSIVLTSPLAYPDLVRAVSGSRGVVTDSGGLQKEAFLLRVPCTTVRPETEWVETVELGWNVLVGADVDRLAEAVERPRPLDTDAAPYGDGTAAEHVVDVLIERAIGS